MYSCQLVDIFTLLARAGKSGITKAYGYVVKRQLNPRKGIVAVFSCVPFGFLTLSVRYTGIY